MGRASILLVEDNERIQKANRDMLRLLGYDVSIAMSLAEARRCVEAKPPDAIVLDIMLPDGSGLDFLREVREASSVPVLMLTALRTPDDTVRGFSTGADDYVAKPYDYRVLAARIEALLRRADTPREAVRKLQKGPLELDVISSRAFLKGQDMLLAQKEFSMLLFFVQNEGKFVSAEQVYGQIWHQPMADDANAVRTVASRLRKKLEGSGCTLTSGHGKGYCFKLSL
jgi:DNA-binding response OmpR family regulator